MFHAQQIDKHAVISGFADGSEWILKSSSGHVGFFGPGRAKMWQLRESEIRLFDVPTRTIEGSIPVALRGSDYPYVSASPDGVRIYIVTKSPRPANESDAEKRIPLSDLIMVDLEQRKVVKSLHDLPVKHDDRRAVMADGALLLGWIAFRDGGPIDLVARIDPQDFTIAESFVPVIQMPDSYAGIHWAAHSPDGRWWLRLDHTSFPMAERAPAPGQPPRRYYGVTLQLWSAFPLRFERRIVLYWLKAENLPDKTHIMKSWSKAPPPAPPQLQVPQPRPRFLGRVFGRKGLSHSSPVGKANQSANADPRMEAMMTSVPERDRIYTAISRALHRPDLPPDAPFPDRSDFGPEATTDAILWTAITQNLDEFAHRAPGNVIGWEDGGDSVWFDRVGFTICAGMDGSVSPQLWCERSGLKDSMIVPFANGAEVNIPQPGRKLLAIMPPREAIPNMMEAREGGAMTIDGSGVADSFEPAMITQATDGWVPGRTAIPEHVLRRTEFQGKIRQAKLEGSVVRIAASSSDTAGRVAAISELANRLGPDFFDRADHHDIDVVFQIDGKDVREAKFFSAIGPEDREWAVPVLRNLVERYVAHVDYKTYYQPKGDGDSVLAHAVLRLAELDAQSLPLIRAYGQKIDGGHEYFFAGKTVPAVIAAHGWTQDVIRFVTWAMIYNFYNTYDRISTVWRNLGLSAAAAQSSPKQYATMVVDEFAGEITSGTLSWDALATLRRELASDTNTWEQEFLDELERLAPGSTTGTR